MISLSGAISHRTALEPRKISQRKNLHAEKLMASKLRSPASALKGVDGAAR